MREGWKKLNLESLGFVGRGKSRHRPRNAEFLFGDKYPFVQTADVKAANYKITSYSQMYSEEGLKQSKLWPVDTLCITIAANIADAALLGIEACFPDSVIGFIPDDNKADVRFVKYLFDLLQVRIKQISQGAAQDNLSLEKLRTIKFDVPPLNTQRKIASILSAYDDLIENNLKRIKLLEEQAQLTYEEWFVRFKFPGHETTKFDDETGLPEGWEKKGLGEFTDIKKGKNITKATIKEGNVPVIAGGLKPAYYHNKPNTVNPVITVSASGANAGYTAIQLENVWASDCSFIDSSMTKYLHFVYCTMIANQPKIYHSQKGAAQPHVYPKDLVKLEVTIPSIEVIQGFEDFAKNIFDSIRIYTKQNQHLKEARDILLPRLMSGMIDVEKINFKEISKNVAVL